MLTFPRKRVGIVPIYDPDMSPGGIIIPEIAKERVDQGIVKYVGPEVDTDWLKPGDYVLFSGWTGTLMLFADEKLIVMPEEFVLCKVLLGDSMVVPGLYYRTGLGTYIPATYESAVPLIADAFTDFRKTLQVKAAEPTNEDIERMRG